MNNLETQNPNHFIYNHPPLEISVLGGIRLEGLDPLWRGSYFRDNVSQCKPR